MRSMIFLSESQSVDAGNIILTVLLSRQLQTGPPNAKSLDILTVSSDLSVFFLTQIGRIH